MAKSPIAIEHLDVPRAHVTYSFFANISLPTRQAPPSTQKPTMQPANRRKPSHAPDSILQRQPHQQYNRTYKCISDQQERQTLKQGLSDPRDKVTWTIFVPLSLSVGDGAIWRWCKGGCRARLRDSSRYGMDSGYGAWHHPSPMFWFVTPADAPTARRLWGTSSLPPLVPPHLSLDHPALPCPARSGPVRGAAPSPGRQEPRWWERPRFKQTKNHLRSLPSFIPLSIHLSISGCAVTPGGREPGAKHGVLVGILGLQSLKSIQSDHEHDEPNSVFGETYSEGTRGNFS